MALLLLVPALALAQAGSGSTGWMQLVKGYRDQATGAELRDIERDAVARRQNITVAIPKSAINAPGAMEEVRVVGQGPGKLEPLIDYSYEWVEDYDNDYYGLLIHLGEGEEFPFRIFMDSEAGFTQ